MATDSDTKGNDESQPKAKGTSRNTGRIRVMVEHKETGVMTPLEGSGITVKDEDGTHVALAPHPEFTKTEEAKRFVQRDLPIPRDEQLQYRVIRSFGYGVPKNKTVRELEWVS